MKRYGITVGDNIKLNVRLVDCVGYLVNNAIGYLEDDMPRMVKTPWSTEEIPFCWERPAAMCAAAALRRP